MLETKYGNFGVFYGLHDGASIQQKMKKINGLAFLNTG